MLRHCFDPSGRRSRVVSAPTVRRSKPPHQRSLCLHRPFLLDGRIAFGSGEACNGHHIAALAHDQTGRRWRVVSALTISVPTARFLVHQSHRPFLRDGRIDFETIEYETVVGACFEYL